MPMREIQKKYTKSEIAIMAWRSSEMAFNMGVNTLSQAVNKPVAPVAASNPALNGGPEQYLETVSDPELKIIEERLGPVAYKIMDEKTGEVNLTKLSGAEALRYMSAMGIPIGGRS